MKRRSFLIKSGVGLTYVLAVPMLSAQLVNAANDRLVRSKSFHVNRYGAKGDGITDDSPAIGRAVAAAVKAGSGSEVVFDNRTYRLGYNRSTSYHIDLHNVHDVHFRGNGALLLNNPRNSIFSLRECSDISVSDFQVDCFPLAFTQGTVIDVDGSNRCFDLEIHQGYSHPVDEVEKNGSIMNTEPGKEDWGMFIEAGSRSRKPDVADHIRMERIERGHRKDIARIFVSPHVPIALAALTKVNAGDHFVIAYKYGHSASNISISDSANCLFENFHIYSTKHNMTFGVSNNAGQITFRNINMVFKPGSDRLIATSSDGFHCKHNRVGPLIENSYFEGLLDDSINISTTPSWIARQESARVLWIRGQGFNVFRTGDRVMAFTPGRNELIDQIRVVSVIEMENGYRRLVIDKDIPNPGLNLSGNYFPGGQDKMGYTGIYNLDACGAGYIIRNNKFNVQRRHAMLVRAPHGQIEGNEVNGVGGRAIHMTNEAGSFYEGPFPEDTLIQNNNFKNCLNVPVEIGAKHTGGSRMAKNISLVNNDIMSKQNCCLNAYNIEGLQMVNNRFSSSVPGLAAEDLVCLNNVVRK